MLPVDILFFEKSQHSQTSPNTEKQKFICLIYDDMNYISGRELKRWHWEQLQTTPVCIPLLEEKEYILISCSKLFFRFSAFLKQFSMEIISALICDTLYCDVLWWFTAEKTINISIEYRMKAFSKVWIALVKFRQIQVLWHKDFLCDLFIVVIFCLYLCMEMSLCSFHCVYL